VSAFETALKAAAFDAAGAALEVRADDGALVLANAAVGEGLGDGAAKREERLVRGRAALIERRSFAFDGCFYRVAAALDVDGERQVRDSLYARAFLDSATGLPNRGLCEHAMAEMIAARNANEAFAVVVVEIEKFQQIAAFHGERASEQLAANIGERLSRDAAPGDLIARTGPDEFCLLIAHPGGPDITLVACRRLVDRIIEPYLVDGVEIFAGASAGVCYWPRNDATPEGLRRKAKAAAREARRGGGGARLFEAEIERRVRARAQEENALRLAIRDQRIGCAFQPKIDFRAGVVDSLEVLMRWRREDGVWSTPGSFLELAHEVGLTNDITGLVFAETIASLDAINQAFGAEPRIGFNIAARQASDGRFMRTFLEGLAASGHARRFMLEITEEAFLPSSQFQARVLPLIREIGAGISIDDFGSGYSSLAMLADITADEVKVDRSLITDIDQRPRNQSLLRAIESIGEALSTEVVVEGVETAEEFRYLHDHTRIRVAQGYYFAKPLMLSGVEEGVEWRASQKRRALSERYGRAREVREG
jgi:diguanylate cyclase (GGDEF)-like protein